MFSCVFSKNAFRKELLKFIFVEDIDSNGLQVLADGLSEYVSASRGWDGDIDTAYPLLIAFSITAICVDTVDKYHSFGWDTLQKLHKIDPAPWPDFASRDPESPSWSMCFSGMPLFCNMSNPAHKLRLCRSS
ncbi:YqcI/YcgG family protein [Pseudomonas sp. LRF_L74]|uniref:YqcI/YcgG family protein n=1 Tax=Pseudomonas sp. LRF_L74 TaxID=3369422 RepID=UPI003F5EBFD2